MKANHSEIITLLSKYLERFPEHRFSQALFNLRVLESEGCEGNNPPVIKDPYNNMDEAVLERMKAGMKFFDHDDNGNS